MNDKMLVLKFGGTSVGAPDRMKKVASLIKRTPQRKIVVLSALSGTTNALVAIGEDLLAGSQDDANQRINDLERHYLNFTQELYSESAQPTGREMVASFFSFIRGLCRHEGFGDKENRELLAQGELMSTSLFFKYMQDSGDRAYLLPALEFMSIDSHHEPELPQITRKLQSLLESLKDCPVILTQGYICLNSDREIDNLKRGGSDYTASLIGAAVKAEEVQIWTDIDGMHNNDPRMVRKTQPVSELTFDEASELAYFGAKILHPSTILPAQKFNIPVRLKNTMAEDAPGTLISNKASSGTIKAVAAKDGITAIKIKSSRMLMAYGFLVKVFEIFEKYKTPIDMITTSEIAVSLTIDNNNHLDAIVSDLKEIGHIDVDKDQTIVCIVGSGINTRKDVLGSIFTALNQVPVRMVSCGGSNNNISILVDTVSKGEALESLNKGLFNL